MSRWYTYTTAAAAARKIVSAAIGSSTYAAATAAVFMRFKMYVLCCQASRARQRHSKIEINPLVQIC